MAASNLSGNRSIYSSKCPIFLIAGFFGATEVMPVTKPLSK